MSEISREEAIEHLEHELRCMPKEPPIDIDYKEEWWDEQERIIRTKEKTILEMQKLEKIKEVIISMECTDDETLESFAFRQIEKIVKE